MVSSEFSSSAHTTDSSDTIVRSRPPADRCTLTFGRVFPALVFVACLTNLAGGRPAWGQSDDPQANALVQAAQSEAAVDAEDSANESSEATGEAALDPAAGIDYPDQAAVTDDISPADADLAHDARTLSRAFRFAARKATPSVVTVFSYGQNTRGRGKRSDKNKDDEDEDESLPEDRPMGPSPPKMTEDEGLPLTGMGSGVIVDTDGWVMTNHHVIRNARRVIVQLSDETELIATGVYGDPDSDVAVIRLKPKRPLVAARYGDSDALEIGDWVLAIGSPFKLEATVSAGIISARDRTIDKIRRGRLLQTDAAINPGNSGGALINLDGHLVAINTAIATRNGGNQGIGFAIPINHARWIAKELSQYGKVRRAAMGIRLAELNPKLAKQLKLPTNLGVLVYQVVKDSAADQAGLKNLDIILEFAGQRVRKPATLQEVVERQAVGSTQKIKIRRGDETLIREIILAPLEDPTDVSTPDGDNDEENDDAKDEQSVEDAPESDDSESDDSESDDSESDDSEDVDSKDDAPQDEDSDG